MANKKETKIKAKSKVASALNVPEVVDIKNVEAFLSSVRDAMANSNDIELDCSKVERMTTPGIQVILSAAKTAVEKGGKITLKDPSENMTVIFNDLGLSEQLQEWKG